MSADYMDMAAAAAAHLVVILLDLVQEGRGLCSQNQVLQGEQAVTQRTRAVESKRATVAHRLSQAVDQSVHASQCSEAHQSRHIAGKHAKRVRTPATARCAIELHGLHEQSMVERAPESVCAGGESEGGAGGGNKGRYVLHVLVGSAGGRGMST
jgi:hypothetical protein